MEIIQVGRPGGTPPEWRQRLDAFNKQHFGFPMRDHIAEAWWWVVCLEGRIVGFAGASDDGDGNFFVGPCGIAPSARGRGLQRTLIVVRESVAIAEGFRMAVSYTDVDNYASANNFIRCGYTIGPPWKDFTHEDMTIFWRKKLSERRR